MNKTMKAIKHGLESPLKQYAQEMEQGKQMTEKDAARLANLTMAMVFSKLLCMLEEMKEGGEKEGKGGMGGMLHAMGKQMGGGGQGGMQAMMNAIGLPHIGFDTASHHMPGTMSPYGDHQGMGNRRGVPGSGRGHRAEMDSNYGTYDEMDGESGNYGPEDRRGRSSRTGRYVHRAEMDGMNDNYDNMNMAGGQGGNSGGQSGGNTGGGRR